MKKSHLVIISFQVAIIAIIIVMLGNQTMMLREIREEVTKPQQEIDLTVRTNGLILEMPDTSFVLYDGSIWQKERLLYRTGGDTGFPLLSIERHTLAEGMTLDRFAAERLSLGEGELATNQAFAANTGNFFRAETIADQAMLHILLSDKWPMHSWFVQDPNDQKIVYIFTHISPIGGNDQTTYFVEWILETLRFE